MTALSRNFPRKWVRALSEQSPEETEKAGKAGVDDASKEAAAWSKKHHTPSGGLGLSTTMASAVKGNVEHAQQKVLWRTTTAS